MTDQTWVVYIVECGNKTLYTGITTDLERRIQQHQKGLGARYTRSFGLKRLLWSEPQTTRSAALKREAEIKTWSRLRKLDLVKNNKRRRRHVHYC